MFAIIIGVCDRQKLALILKDYKSVGLPPDHVDFPYETRLIQEKKPSWERKKGEKEEPLQYGDHIYFPERDDLNDNETIYTRSDVTFETRIGKDGKGEICLVGVMTPNRKTFRMLDKFPDVEIDSDELRETAVPNVAIRAWVRLQYTGCSIDYRISEFIEVDASKQGLIQELDWLNLYKSYDDFGEVFEGSEKIMPKAVGFDAKPQFMKMPEAVQIVRGVVASETSIINSKSPEFYYRRCVKEAEKMIWPPTGTFATILAQRLENVNYYAICSFKPKAEVEKPLSVTDNMLLKTTVRYSVDKPGLFKSEQLNIYIDDPLNLLEAFPFSRYANSTIGVAILDGMPAMNGLARWYVAQLTDKKKEKLEEVKNSGEMKIEDELGVVYDHYGRLYITNFPNIMLRLNAKCFRLYRVGTVLRVSADYDKTEKKWKIRSLRKDAKIGRLQTVARLDPNQEVTRIFFHLPTAESVQGMPYLLAHPLFKFITVPTKFKPVVTLKASIYENVWICLNSAHPCDTMPPPFKFGYFGTGKLTPASKIQPALHFDSVESKADSNLDNYYPEEKFGGESSVEQLKEDMLIVESWVDDAQKAVIEDWEAHKEACEKCRTRDTKNQCYFTDFLTDVMFTNDDVRRALNDANLSEFCLERKMAVL